LIVCPKKTLLNSNTSIKLFLAIILIPVGFLTKFYKGIGSEFVINYAGGILYVIFFILIASLVFPRTKPLKISIIMFCIVCLLEFTQKISNDFLINLRGHFIFRTLIGSVFNIADFAFYFIGALIGNWFLMILSNKKVEEFKR
jgi:hypothetical protein